MSSYLPFAGSATSAAVLPRMLPQSAEPVPGLCPPLSGREGTGAPGPPAGMIAFRAADLRVRPAGCGAAGGGAGRPGGAAGATVPAGTMVTFCHPVVTAPAVIRGGAVLAGGWLPDFVG